MNTLGERIRFLRSQHNLTQEELANRINVTRAAITNWELNRNRPSTDDVVFIADALHTDANYLLTGKSTLNIATNFDRGDYIKLGQIPLLGYISAGIPIAEQPSIIGYVQALPEYANEEHFALQISGDSMEPILNNGDIVYLIQTTQWNDGDMLAVLYNGESCIKRVSRSNGSLILTPENKKYLPIVISAGDVILQGKVVARLERF